MVDITTNSFIVLFTYISIYLLKTNIFTTDKDRKNLPPIAAVIGGLLGCLLYLGFPGILECTNIVEACAMGMYSGLAAVGINQVYKQYNNFKIDDKEDTK